MATTESLFGKIWAWIKSLFAAAELKTLGEIITYLKDKFGEAEVVADQKNFSSWAAYIIQIIKDLITLSQSAKVSTKSGLYKTAAVNKFAKEVSQ